MKILQVHKYLYRKAGAEAYMLDLVELLKRHGHEVKIWGPEEPLNFDRREGMWRDVKKFGHMIWSFEAARKFERVLREFRPEVIHIHNLYHHISPSILRVAKKYGVPVIMTVHDYHLVNPNYILYDHGEICEQQGFSAIAHRCIKNSFVASAADVIEQAIHQWLGVYRHTISRYLAPTNFVKRKLVEGGVDEKKIEVVSLPVVVLHATRYTLQDYVLYAGRLTEEKGIYLVLEIAKQMPEICFRIAGDGPEMSNLALQVTRYKLQNVVLVGFVEKETLQGLIAGARLVLTPSLWYDPSPLAVLEAMAAGKVVVGSKIGGIPELIDYGKTGFLVNVIASGAKQSPRSPRPSMAIEGLAMTIIFGFIDTIKKVYYDKPLLVRVGKAAQEYVRRVHNPEKHYAQIMEIYRNVSG